MVGRLTRPAGWRRPGWRRAAFAALVVLVGWLHLVVTRDLAERLATADADAGRPMPARIEVAYVRTLEPEAPRVADVVASPPPAAPAPRAVESAARAASAAAAALARAQAQARAEAREAEAAARAEAIARARAETRARAEAWARARSPTTEPAPDPALASASAAEPGPRVAADASPAQATPAAATPEGAALAAAPAASAPGGATFAWPAATRVSYLLSGHWRGELTGRAEVEWIRVGGRYQVNVDLSAGPEFAPLFSRRMTSEGRLGETGLAPDRYDEDTQVVMRDRRRVSVRFEPDAVVLANGDRRQHLRGVQDSASQFIQFTWLFGTRPELLRVGNRFEVPLALPRSMSLWTYEVAAEQTLDTPFGPLATFHLKPRRESRKSGEWLVDMWFAPELRFLPVRIRIEQESGSFVDLVIARKPEIAAS